MFNHEIAHIYYRRSPEKLDVFKRSYEGLLKGLEDMLGDYEQEIAGGYPDFKTDVARGLFEHQLLSFFLEEVACDFQSFVLGARTIVVSSEKHLWVTGLSNLHLASFLLTLGERMLKIGSSFWAEFAMQTGDGTTLDTLKAEEGKLAVPNLSSQRPIFSLRQSITQLALIRFFASKNVAGAGLEESFNVIVNSHIEIKTLGKH